MRVNGWKMLYYIYGKWVSVVYNATNDDKKAKKLYNAMK